MLDRLTGMQVFVRVAALGSFSAAARTLSLSQTMVTRHVQALEALVWDRPGESRDLDLPGHVRAQRRGRVIRLASSRPSADDPVAG